MVSFVLLPFLDFLASSSSSSMSEDSPGLDTLVLFFLAAGSLEDLAGRPILLAVSWRAASWSPFGCRLSLIFCCIVAIMSLGGVFLLSKSPSSSSSAAGVIDSTGVRVPVSGIPVCSIPWVESPKKSSSSGLEDTSMGKPVSKEVTTVFFAGPSVGSVGRRGLGDGGSVGWRGVRLGGGAPPAA